MFLQAILLTTMASDINFSDIGPPQGTQSPRAPQRRPVRLTRIQAPPSPRREGRRPIPSTLRHAFHRLRWLPPAISAADPAPTASPDLLAPVLPPDESADLDIVRGQPGRGFASVQRVATLLSLPLADSLVNSDSDSDIGQDESHEPRRTWPEVSLRIDPDTRRPLSAPPSSSSLTRRDVRSINRGGVDVVKSLERFGQSTGVGIVGMMRDLRDPPPPIDWKEQIGDELECDDGYPKDIQDAHRHYPHPTIAEYIAGQGMSDVWQGMLMYDLSNTGPQVEEHGHMVQRTLDYLQNTHGVDYKVSRDELRPTLLHHHVIYDPCPSIVQYLIDSGCDHRLSFGPEPQRHPEKAHLRRRRTDPGPDQVASQSRPCPLFTKPSATYPMSDVAIPNVIEYVERSIDEERRRCENRNRQGRRIAILQTMDQQTLTKRQRVLEILRRAEEERRKIDITRSWMQKILLERAYVDENVAQHQAQIYFPTHTQTFLSTQEAQFQ